MKNIKKSKGVWCTPARRRKIWLKTAGTCYYCGKLLTIKKEKCNSENYMTIDHYIPVIQGGDKRIDNLVPSCQECNNLKSNFNPNDRIEKLVIDLRFKRKGVA